MNGKKGFLSGRVSIWSISRNWGQIYYILFSAQTTIALGLISRHEIFVRDKDTPTETLIAIGQASAPLILTIAAETLVIILAMEAIEMLAERYLKRRYEAGEEAQRARHNERIRIHNARVDAWEERRLRAQAEGKPFDEPVPRLGEDDNA